MADNRHTSGLTDLLKDQPPQEPRFDQNGDALSREEIKMLPEGVTCLPWREDERLKLSFPYDVSPGVDEDEDDDEEEKEEKDEEEEIKVVPVAVTVAEKVKSIELWASKQKGVDINF